MRVALYARVSTDDQTTKTQIRELKKYCCFKGWTDLTIFIDEGISGTKISRPQFDCMIAQAKAKEFDIVMVWRFDRASRSTKHLLLLLDDFNKWGVDFVSVREQIDTSTAMGKFFFTITAALSQLERDNTADRTKVALSRIKAEGGLYHRPRSCNYDEVRALKRGRTSTKSIAKRFNISESHVRRIVREAA